MDINIRNENNTLSLNLIGQSVVIPHYHGKVTRTTQGGRTKTRWTSKINTIALTIEYLEDENYDDVIYMLESSDYLFVTTEYGKKYKCVFIDEQLDLKQDINANGDVFWTGSINFKE